MGVTNDDGATRLFKVVIQKPHGRREDPRRHRRVVIVTALSAEAAALQVENNREALGESCRPGDIVQVESAPFVVLIS